MATMVSKPSLPNTPKAAQAGEEEESDSEGTIATMVSQANPVEVDLTTSKDSDSGNEDVDPGDETDEDAPMPDLEDILTIEGRQRPTDQNINYWRKRSTSKDTESPEGMLEVMDYYTTARAGIWWMETPTAERSKIWSKLWYQIQKLGHRYWGTYMVGHSFRKYLLQLTPSQLAKAADNKSTRNNYKPTLKYYAFQYPTPQKSPPATTDRQKAQVRGSEE